ncbi:hypothetical protein MMC13_002652 [Lambiella insularis]|nr:hypothetical protein [Lambiella insularis]
MTDYSKYTVVKLKEELKARGLPQTGLKAVLIQRLSEAVSSEEAPAVPDAVETTEKEPESNAQLPDSEANATEVNGFAYSDTNARDDEHIERVVEGSIEKDAPKRLSTSPPEAANEEASVVPEQAQNGTLQQDSPVQEASQPVNTQESTAPLEDTKPPGPPADVAATAPPETPASSGEAPMISLVSTQTSLNKEEILEDSRKRKRRSHSPLPSTFDTALKKAKALDGSPRVKLPEDEGVEQDLQRTSNREDDSALSGTLVGEISADVPMPSFEDKVQINTTEESTKAQLEPVHTSEDLPSKHGAEKLPMDNLQSPIKTSPSDTRFKNLFSASNHTDQPPAQEVYADIEDRDISPAIHPATSALYIRNFMRPLQPTLLRSHLAALANRSTSSPSSDVVTDFFLDSIKTHCLVRFTSVSAASRVRTALHDRVWPDERTRKPLFIDYVPEEKLSKWIEVEQSGSGGRQQGAKRWEVVYEQEAGGVTAYLQEADGNGPPRPLIPAAAAVALRVPTGPKAVDAKPPVAPVPKGDPGKGFKALDDLFKSTAVKPKLYFLPVSSSTSSRRLEKLAAGRGNGRSDEMRRFTFEEDTIVDKGPEFGSGWRGGARGRGAYAGGYGGRGAGGGYRGGRGDSWR